MEARLTDAPAYRFDAVLGHERELKVLTRGLESGRLAHSYLFQGPEMIGKLFAAFNFALAAVCASEIKPCLECEECRRARRMNHPDVFVFSQGRKISVEDVEWFNERLNAPPVSAERKVFIVDGAEMMTDDAPHRMLKTLEELGDGRVVILVTHQPDRLLSTIRSRCQVLKFSSVQPPLIQGWLDSIGVEGTGAAGSLGAISSGRPGYALRLLLAGEHTRAFETADVLAQALIQPAGEAARHRLRGALESYLGSFESGPEETDLAGLFPAEVVEAASDSERLKALVEERGSASGEQGPLKRQLQERALELVLSALKSRLERMLAGDTISADACRMALEKLDKLFEAKEQLRRNIHPGIIVDNLVYSA